jgi:hypothetical protein
MGRGGVHTRTLYYCHRQLTLTPTTTLSPISLYTRPKVV